MFVKPLFQPQNSKPSVFPRGLSLSLTLHLALKCPSPDCKPELGKAKSITQVSTGAKNHPGSSSFHP